MKRGFLLVSTVLLLHQVLGQWQFFFQDFQLSSCKWIWYNEYPRKGETRYFRKEFVLDSKVKDGVINVAGDDIIDFYINGKKVISKGGFKNNPILAKQYLVKGKNVFAAKVLNVVSGAGFLLRAKILTTGGKVVVINTNTNWKTTKTVVNNQYTLVNFNDNNWSKPIIVRDVTTQHSWRRMINVKAFLSEKEYQNFNQRIHPNLVKAMQQDMLQKLSIENKAEKVSIIRRNGVPFYSTKSWTHPVFLYNSVYLKPVPGEQGHMPRLRRFHDYGFRVFCVLITLKDFWKQDHFDFDSAEKLILNMLCATPLARLNVVIDLTPPEWFLKKYPDECIKYASNAKAVYAGDELRIAALRPSMASSIWKEETGKIVSKLIEKLESSLVAKRILSYQLNNGLYAEWHYYGMPKEMPDTSKAMTIAFRKYLQNKYKNDLNLQKAWQDKLVTIATAKVPEKEARLYRPSKALLNPVYNRAVEDYLHFHASVINDCQMFFNKIAKTASNNRALIGNYSGYFFGMAYPAIGYQTGTPKMMKSPFMDFQAAPYSYAFRSSGQTGLPRNVFESYVYNNKLTILESDARTHKSGDSYDMRSSSANDSIGQLTRDFCNAITRGAGLWYYDFAAGWYDEVEYLSLFRSFSHILQAKQDVTRVSQVAYVCDFDSVNYHTNAVNPNDFTFRFINNTINELFYSGIAFDTILLEDLEKSFSKYKVIILGNLIHYTTYKANLIKKLLKSNKTLVFLYAPGVVSDNGVNAQNIEKLIGVKTKIINKEVPLAYDILPNKEKLLSYNLIGKNFSLNLSVSPFIIIDDEDVNIMGKTPYKNTLLSSLGVKSLKENKIILATVPYLGRQLIQNICKDAKINCYTTNNNDVLYITKGLIGIHSKSLINKKILLPMKAKKIIQLLPTKRQLPANNIINVNINNAQTALYKIEY